VTADTHQAIDAIWRIEQAKIIAGLARIMRDVGTGGAGAGCAGCGLKVWPEAGIPDNPGAWLMATAKTRRSMRGAAPGCQRKHEELGREMDEHETPTRSRARR